MLEGHGRAGAHHAGARRARWGGPRSPLPPGGDPEGAWGNVAYTPDGHNLVSVFGDGTAATWPVSVDAWEQHACAVAGRSFTREEWARFVGSRSYAPVCGPAA